MKTEIALSLSRDYVGHWSWKEAVRELIQNALDCEEHSIRTFYNGDIIIFTEGGAISRQALLLGNSGKKEGDTIGHFGEGLKLALLILVREGYPVTIRSGKDVWTPVLKFSEQYGTECLHIEIEHDEDADENSVVAEIKGFDSDQLYFVENMYIHRSLIEDAVVDHKGNRVYNPETLMGEDFDPDHDEAVAKVFVGGLYVCDLPEGYKYSYDLRPGRIKLDRDRRTVGSWDMAWEVSRLLTEAGRADLLVELSKENARDVEGYTESHRSYSSYLGNSGSNSVSFTERLRDLAVASFVERNGPKAIPVNQEMESTKKRLFNTAIQRAGYHPVSVKPSEFAMLGDAIKIPDNIEIISEPDVIEELQTLLKQYKIAPAPKGKIENLLERLKEWKEFTR